MSVAGADFLVKVCGVREPTFAAFSGKHTAGADAIGVINSPKSVRHVSDVGLAREVAAAAREAGSFAVLVSAELPVAELVDFGVAAGFDVLQLHGPRYTRDDFAFATEAFGRVWRAVSLAHEPGLVAGGFGEEFTLLDSPAPGSGEQWDVGLLADADLRQPWLLAGGLSPVNVGAAVAAFRPFGVDVASGVECAPGVKSEALVREFVANARAAAAGLS